MNLPLEEGEERAILARHSNIAIVISYGYQIRLIKVIVYILTDYETGNLFQHLLFSSVQWLCIDQELVAQL